MNPTDLRGPTHDVDGPRYQTGAIAMNDDDWQNTMAEPHADDLIEFTENLGDGYTGLQFRITTVRHYDAREGWAVEVVSVNHAPDEAPRRFIVALHEEQIVGHEYWRYVS